MRHTIGAGVGCVIVLTASVWLAAVGPAFPPQSDTVMHAVYYKAGADAMRAGNYPVALAEFEKITSHPQSPFAGRAWLELARYYFDVAPDADRAQQAADALQQFQSDPVVGPAALLYSGRRLLMGARDTAARAAAFAEFARAAQYFPRHPFLADAWFYEADARRLGLETELALTLFRQLSTSYPHSPWAPKALLGEARCLVALGRAGEAFRPLQRLRSRHPAAPEAATARAWNTLLLRLYLRGYQPFRPTGRFIAGTSGKLQDVTGLASGEPGTIVVLNKAGWTQFDSVSGRQQAAQAAADLRSVLPGPGGQPIAVGKRGLLLPGGRPVTLAVPQGNETRPLEDIEGAVLTSRRDVVVADSRRHELLRFALDGRHLDTVAVQRADRIAIDGEDRIAALDEDAEAVWVRPLEGGGAVRAGLPKGYRPVDVAFDPLGHLYVLVPASGAVAVFAPGNLAKPCAMLSVPAKSPAAFDRGTALAVDSSGRVFIYDKGAQRIQIYR